MAGKKRRKYQCRIGKQTFVGSITTARAHRLHRARIIFVMLTCIGSDAQQQQRNGVRRVIVRRSENAAIKIGGWPLLSTRALALIFVMSIDDNLIISCVVNVALAGALITRTLIAYTRASRYARWHAPAALNILSDIRRHGAATPRKITRMRYIARAAWLASGI